MHIIFPFSTLIFFYFKYVSRLQIWYITCGLLKDNAFVIYSNFGFSTINVFQEQRCDHINVFQMASQMENICDSKNDVR